MTGQCGTASGGSARPPVRAYLGMIAATLFWSSNAVVVKLLLREFPLAQAAGLRVCLAAVALAVLHLALGGRFHLRREEIWRFLSLGMWGLALSFLFFTLGLYYTSIAHAVFVGALVPLAVLLLARREGQERLTVGKLAGLVVALTGVLVLALDRGAGSGPNWKGDLLALCGVICFAHFTVQSKKISSQYDPVFFNMCCFAGGGLLFLPWIAATVRQVPWSEITLMGWTSLGYSAIFGSAGAYLTFYYSLRWMKASEAAVFHYLQPVLATAFGMLFFGDVLTGPFAAAAALILSGVIIAERW
ncbi:MAG: hypothetical protein A3F68_12665 [Acidobacteria bacterium RIFCSPLOWO2_12_FULL_54_10]|nr:MAG: hypothetical protein A3F68_12665 [Acidobacteria bacterium RIFCSPLOWO2_12_FULL_54_10]